VLAAVLTAVSLGGLRGESAAAQSQLDPVEQEFMDILNEYRADNGLGAVIVDADIQEAAEWMSGDMGEKGYFSHTDSLGRSPWTRMCDFGYCHNTWKGENIAAGYQTAQAVFNAWRDSPGHNANMLGENYRVIGIARVYTAGSPYGYYWTNDFAGHVVDPSPPPAPTNTPTPTPTPTATPSPSPSPTPAPTATPTPAPPAFAANDLNCDDAVTLADVLVLLSYAGGLSTETPDGCPPVGAGAGQPQAAGGTGLRGDIDCNQRVDAADALAVLLSAAQVGPTSGGSCAG
jgi:uncharacterized protein YkwD